MSEDERSIFCFIELISAKWKCSFRKVRDKRQTLRFGAEGLVFVIEDLCLSSEINHPPFAKEGKGQTDNNHG